MAGSEIELEMRTMPREDGLSNHGSFVERSVEENDIAPVNAVSLPPVDTGFGAWAYLASAFFLELIVWTYPFSYGVFLNYYNTKVYHGASSSVLAVAGSVGSGLLYLTSIVILFFVNRYPWYKRHVMVFGLVMAVAGLVGAAYSTKPWQLVLTQGIMYSLGGSLLYFPMSTWMFEWFSAKKGLAAGIIFSGTGIGGVVMPIIVERLLDAYGPKTTLLAMAIAFLIFALPCFPYLKPRLPVARIVGPRSFDTRFARSGSFWILFVTNAVQGLAYIIPSLYIPTFASDLNLSSTSGTLVLSVLYGASAPGYIFMGWLSDRYDLRYSILLSSIGSGLSVLLLWGLAEGLPLLIVFACAYGFLASSWSALWSRFATVSSDDPHQVSSVWSIFCAGKGVGAVISAPIASSLLRTWYFTGKSDFAYSVEGYGPLILFTGLSLLVTSLASFYRSPLLPKRFTEFLTSNANRRLLATI